MSRNFYGLLSFAIVVLASICVHNRGWLHRETDMYLVDHLSDRSLLSKVLCPNAADALYHQGRPLNHFLEYVDAHFVYFCTLAGHPHFLSITSYGLLIAVCLIHWRCCQRLLRMDPGITWLTILLFWTTPSIFFSGVHFRSAKPGVASLAVVLMWLMILYLPFRHPTEGKVNRAQWWIVLFVAVCLCLMDPQGFYLATAFFVSVLSLVWVAQNHAAKSIASALLAALLLYSLWYWALAPWLIREVNGFEVIFTYPRSRWQLLFASTWQFWCQFYLLEGVTLTLDNIRFYLGNVPRALAAAALGYAAYIYHKTGTFFFPVSWRPSLSKLRLGTAAIAVWAIMLGIMNVVMINQHPPLQMEEFRLLGPHRIPTNALVLMGITFLAHRLLTSGTLSTTAMRAILLVLLASNLFALPAHDSLYRQGWFKAYRDATPIMMQALKELVRTPRQAAGQPYDFDKNARSTAKRMLRAGPDLLDENDSYLESSHYYNFLRSRYGLAFRQE